MNDLLYNPGNDEMIEVENKKEGDVSSLPSRKVTHPKPKSFFEKPLFTFFLFLLFVALLITIFLYFYSKDSNHWSPIISSLPSATQKEGRTPPSPPSTTPQGREGEKGIPEQTRLHESPLPSQKSSTPPVREEAEEGGNPTNLTGEDKGSTASHPVQHVEKGGSGEKGKTIQGRTIRYEVKEKDTLFRLAMKFYGSQSGIEKIKKANGLKGDEIYVGSILTIPSPTP